VVALLADSPVLAVDDVVEHGAVGQGNLSQVAQHVVVVSGGGAADGLGFQFAVGAVVIARVVVVEQPVLGVVESGRAVRASPHATALAFIQETSYLLGLCIKIEASDFTNINR